MKVRGANRTPIDYRTQAKRLQTRAVLLLLLFPAAGCPQTGPAAPTAPVAAEVFALLHPGSDGRPQAALREFYRNRGFEPVWFTGGRQNPLVAEISARLSKAAAEGLDPLHYALPDAPGSTSAPDTFEEIARADLALTGVLMDYAADLHDGHPSPREVDRRWRIVKERLDVAHWLGTALDQQRLVHAMDELPPPHPVYRQLRRALADYRAMSDRGGWPPFPPAGPRRLELGDRDPQVVDLRKRLKATDGPVPEGDDPALFDGVLEEAVKRFQRRHGLNEDGVVGRRTRVALGVPVDVRISQLQAAMERWRWMPRDLGPSYVLVNVPAQRLWFYDQSTAVLSMRIIVGKYKRQTPTFSSAISYFVLRPKWYVPNSIAVKDLVPKAQKDPEYYRRAGFTVYDKASGEAVDPDGVDWDAYGVGQEFPFRLVQRAGDDNALGYIKFMFPNPYGVYLHDTSTPSLFLKDARFFSSGCIRVESPLELASKILSQSRSGPVAPAEIERMIQSSPVNRHLNLERTIPLHVAYMTAWADKNGVYFYDDFYKRDAKLLNRLGD